VKRLIEKKAFYKIAFENLSVSENGLIVTYKIIIGFNWAFCLLKEPAPYNDL